MLKSQDIRDERNLECPPEKPETTHIISSSPYQGTRRHDVFVNYAHGSFHLLAESSQGLTSSLVPFSEPRLLSSLLQSRQYGHWTLSVEQPPFGTPFLLVLHPRTSDFLGRSQISPLSCRILARVCLWFLLIPTAFPGYFTRPNYELCYALGR